MKNTFKFYQMFLLMSCGVFGVDADKVKTVSVMEGDSVTLNSDVTETQRIILMLWRFGDKGSTIAQITGKAISYPKHIDIFTGKLQLDPTGSLTIKNMRTKHSGLYKLQIDLNSGTSYMMNFNVTVYESPSVVDAGEAEMKSVSVTEGDSVILQTDVTDTLGDELIVWRYGDKGKLIAKHDIEAKSLTNDADERFRDRLKLDEKTGSLTITNSRTTDSGLYTVKISSNSKQTLYRRFIVTVSESGLSSGAVAGIVIGLLLVFAAAAAAAAAGVIYYRRKISEQETELKTVSVIEGDDVTLNTDVTEIQTADLIEWRFGDRGHLIAELRRGSIEIYDIGVDERFGDRLKLDKKTGSLTIKNTKNTDSGLYQLIIRQDSKVKYKMFYVSVCEESVSVNEGDPVTLKTDTEIHRDDVIEWRFGNKEHVIAELRGGILKYDDVPDGRFRGRLELDEKTGSLTITNTEVKHARVYKLLIKSNSGDSYKKFRVVVRVRNKSVEEGKNLILHPDTEIQKDDQIQWRFGDHGILIAELRGGTGKTHDDDADGIFINRLKLDEKTGSLIIRDLKAEHTGVYKLHISSSRGTSNNRFVVTVYSRMISVLERESVTLECKTEIQKDDQIQWRFGDILIAEIREGSEPIHYEDGIFGDRLTLDEKTGSLTIKDLITYQSGDYKLQISSSRGTTNNTFSVTVSENVYQSPDPSVEPGVNDSAAVQMPPVDEEAPDGGNEQEGMSLLVMR